MRALLIALGNDLRRDDGVAQAVLQHLNTGPDIQTRTLLQLTPEVAEDIALYDAVLFVDADTRGTDLSIECVDEVPSPPALTHVSRPSEVVALSRALFGFGGRAFLCRIPASDFSHGKGLSPRARALATQAAVDLEAMLRGLSPRI